MKDRVFVIVETNDGIKGIDEATGGLWTAPQAMKDYRCSLWPFQSGSERRTVAQEAHPENYPGRRGITAEGRGDHVRDSHAINGAGRYRARRI